MSRFTGWMPGGLCNAKSTVALLLGIRDDCANKAGNQPLLQRLDQFNFYSTLADTPGPALVLFTAGACGACRHWKQLLQGFSRSDGIPGFEVDAGLDQALAQEFELFHLPALFLFVDGEFHRPLQCAANLTGLRTGAGRRCRIAGRGGAMSQGRCSLGYLPGWVL